MVEEGAEVEAIVAVILGYALFSAAYMAELIRGEIEHGKRGHIGLRDERVPVITLSHQRHRLADTQVGHGSLDVGIQ